MRMRKCDLPLVVAVVALSVCEAHAGSIGVNFVSDLSTDGGQVTNTAGPVAQANWNNVVAACGGLDWPNWAWANFGSDATDLKDDAGSVTTADVSAFQQNRSSSTYFGTADWFSLAPGGSQNQQLYVKSMQANEAVKVHITELPYAKYDVYAAFPVNAFYRIGNVTNHIATFINPSGGFVQATAANSWTGNFVKWSGLTGATLDIADIDSWDDNSAVAWVQIVEQAPEISVRGPNLIEIADGDLTPSAADGTDFGTLLTNSATVTNTFTITNSGALTLYLTSAQIVALTGDTAHFSVNTNGMVTNIASGARTTFKVLFRPTTLGVKTGTVTIANNDGNENPYNFLIQGEGAPLAAEIDLRGTNSASITNLDFSPIVADGTDFGVVDIAGVMATNTYVITNRGYSSLYLTGVPAATIAGDAGDFLVRTNGMTTNIAARGSTAFKIVFDPTVAGTRTGTVAIANSDSDENPYIFAVQGRGLAFVTEMDVLGINGGSITNGDNSPSLSDGTSFGNIFTNTFAVTNTFIITNSGLAELYLTSPQIVSLTGDTADFSINTSGMVTNIATNSFTTFTIKFRPTTIGNKSGTVTIANNDGDENPYRFSIDGRGTAGPETEMDVRGTNSASISCGNSLPSIALGTDFGCAGLPGTVVTNTFVITNSGLATLYLTGQPIVALTGDTGEFSVKTNGAGRDDNTAP